MSPSRPKATFIEPMLLLRTEKLPEGRGWLYEIKYDGFRTLAMKSGGEVQLRSRNDHDFSVRYPAIVKALESMPDETVIDGEIVAMDEAGLPSFNLLQNYASAKTPIKYYVFDVLVLDGQDVMHQTLAERRRLLEQWVVPKLDEPVRYSPPLQATLKDLVRSVKVLGLEGLVAKRADSRYEPGLRSGAWLKMRLNQGQEFVIAGYTPSARNFDALVIGYYDAGKLMYAARTRNGFTPASRAELFKKLRALQIDECPFANLPEKRAGRWGAGLTSAKMAECRWLRPELVGQFEFVEWTPDAHLRHTRFMGLRNDKSAQDVRRE